MAVFVLGENHFRKCGCLVGPKNRIFRKLISVDPKKKALTTEMNFRSYFHFKWIPERERERERERKREKHARTSTVRTHQSAPFARTELQSVPFVSTSAVNHDPRSWSRKVARCFARSRSTAQSSDWSSRSTALSNPVERWASIWVLSVFFWVCLFLLLFQRPENIFRKIFWNATKHMKTFSFPEMLLHEPNIAYVLKIWICVLFLHFLVY